MKVPSIILAAALLIAPLAAAAETPQGQDLVEQSQAARRAEVQRARRTTSLRIDLAAQRAELMRNVLQMVREHFAARVHDIQTAALSAVIAAAK